MSADESGADGAEDEDGTVETTADAEGETPDRPDAGDGPAVDLSAPEYYLNRELSELAFQRRVLNEAQDEQNPVLERAKFLAITTQNMDEFFMKRIGGLKQQLDAGVTERTPDGRTPDEQWEAALSEARELFEAQSTCYHESVRPALADAGARILDYDDLSAADRDRLRSYFEASVLPTLTPLTFDPAHPFPFISNLSLSLAVLTRDGEDDAPKFSRVKVPQNRPRFVPVAAPDDDPADHEAFVAIENVIEANLDLLFPKVDVLDSATFRVTRNAEVRRNEEVAEGLIEMIEDVLRQRRFATVVRLEVASDMSAEVRELLLEQLDVDEREVFERPEPLALVDLWELADFERPETSLPAWQPQPHPRFADLDADRPDELFDAIADDDILVHHPYHSFSGTVQRFLDAAAHDPSVLAIKAAIYRTAPDSAVVQSLIEAAKNGKEVAVMVELKARFDEENNLRWVKRLEEEGIHVAYGTIGLKTHSKIAQVVREDDDGVSLYSHVATGNYHSETAKSYVDLGVFTADPDIGQDILRVFNFFTGHSLHEEYRKLLVAPKNMREELVRLVRREAAHAESGHDARITAKMNALEDPEMVAELYRASMAGVDIDLIVRGICRLRPGLDGVSETVSVHSVVGRFLEHSRILRFENAGDPEFYVGSADWMTRNLDRRVEVVAPVEDEAIRSELQFVLDTMLADNEKRWTMRSDGTYERVTPAEGAERVNTHEVLMERARERAPDEERTPLAGEGRRESHVDLDEVYVDDTSEL